MSQPYYCNWRKTAIIVCLTLTNLITHGQQRLPRQISALNSVDYAPSVSADGNTLIFQSNRDGKFNLYLSTKDESGQWSIPKSLDKINNYGSTSDLIGGPTISYDGNILYYFATFKGGIGNEDIWYSVREGDDFGEPINMGSAINSKGYEGFPSISSDGKKMYFMRANEKQNVKGAFCYVLYESKRNAMGVWQPPKALPAPINLGCEKSPRIMSDNEMLVFASIREGGLSTNKFDLYYSRQNRNGDWGEVKALDYINTPGDELFAAIPACGETLYFVSSDEQLYDTTAMNSGGFKDLDLYSSAMTKESKPKPAILIKGKLVDAETEQSLFGDITIVKNDNKDSRGLLYTNKEDGGFTLVLTKGNTYKVGFNVPGYYYQEINLNTSKLNQCTTTQQDIKLKRWEGSYTLKTYNTQTGNPLDLSVKILDILKNKPLAVKKKEVGHFESKVQSDGQYAVSISSACIDDTTFIFSPTIEDTSMPGIEQQYRFEKEDAKVRMRILNKDTQQPVANAVLLAVDAKTRKPIYRNVLNGDTTLNIDCTGMYVMLGVAANHFSDRQVLDVSKSDAKGLIEMDLNLVELKPGAKLVANNITFNTNSAELNKNSYSEIDQVITVLKQNPQIQIEIAAHTDDVGSVEDNMRLSISRAKSVLDYMTTKGIDVKRLISKGYGESEPAYENNSDEHRALNRRVEFRIPKKK